MLCRKLHGEKERGLMRGLKREREVEREREREGGRERASYALSAQCF